MPSTESSGGFQSAGATPLPPGAGMGPQRQQLPIVDSEVLTELEEDTGITVAHRFVSDYISMWTRRMDAVSQSLAHNDSGSTKEALMSVRSSALMVGARRLADVALTMEVQAANGNLAAVRQSLPVLVNTAELTVRALNEDYLRRAGHSEDPA